ncbi:MAG: hypothetical protein C5B49_06090 [Bdellovibrio sp.]|nr:MAG: hypothetical protein C5B49_06090 [Bdellovibrio sp.]
MKQARSAFAYFIYVAFFPTLTILPQQLFAWGVLGHETVAEIAKRHMSRSAWSKAQQILAGEDFVEVSSWADHVRPTHAYHHTSAYHHSNISDHMSYLQGLDQEDHSELEKGDVVMAILRGASILRNNPSSGEEKHLALKFLIHFIGDAHQPLHTGPPENRGGNDVMVNWFGKQMKLHALWDSTIFEVAHVRDFGPLTARQRAGWYADYLESNVSDTAPREGFSDPLTLVEQSLRQRENCFSGYQGDNQAYIAKALPVIETQLKAAGYRLASMLNDLFDRPANEWPEETALRQGINRITNRNLSQDFESLIVLGPQ